MGTSRKSTAWKYLKTPWVQFGLFAAFLALLLANINMILREARELPGEWGKTSQQFSAWYYDYEAWPDQWTSQPEGDLDQPVMKLAQDAIRIDLELGQKGQLSGTIQSEGLCKNLPYWESALLEGQIDGRRSAELVVFNFVDGHRRLIAILQAKRDGDLMTLTAIDDPWRIIPTSSRITRAPLDIGELEDLCEGKESSLIREAIKSMSAEPQRNEQVVRR